MITPMIIAFKESLEALLILVPLLIYLHKIDRGDLSKYIYSGGALGLFITLITGGLIFGQVTSLQGYSKDFFEGSMMIFIAGLILYNILWMGKNRKNISLDVNKKYISNLTGTSLFLIGCLTVFTDSIEIIMFSLPFINEPKGELVLGMAAGLLLSIITGYLIIKATLKIKININIIFSVISLIFIFVGGEMFGEGLYKIFPAIGETIQTSGKWVFTIPLLFLFIKREIKRYMKK